QRPCCFPSLARASRGSCAAWWFSPSRCGREIRRSIREEQQGSDRLPRTCRRNIASGDSSVSHSRSWSGSWLLRRLLRELAKLLFQRFAKFIRCEPEIETFVDKGVERDLEPAKALHLGVNRPATRHENAFAGMGFQRPFADQVGVGAGDSVG